MAVQAKAEMRGPPRPWSFFIQFISRLPRWNTATWYHKRKGVYFPSSEPSPWKGGKRNLRNLSCLKVNNMHECRSTRLGKQSVEVASRSQDGPPCLGPLSSLLFSFSLFSDSLLAPFKHLTERGEVPHHKKAVSKKCPPEGAKLTEPPYWLPFPRCAPDSTWRCSPGSELPASSSLPAATSWLSFFLPPFLILWGQNKLDFWICLSDGEYSMIALLVFIVIFLTLWRSRRVYLCAPLGLRWFIPGLSLFCDYLIDFHHHETET